MTVGLSGCRGVRWEVGDGVGVSVLDEGRDAGDGHGPGEVEALAVVAAQLAQLIVLRGGLDAFGDDGHS